MVRVFLCWFHVRLCKSKQTCKGVRIFSGSGDNWILGGMYDKVLIRCSSFAIGRYI